MPEPASSFVGRETELADLSTTFARGARLVTVLGPAGIGKTRLALRFARGAARDRRVVLADLTEATSLHDLAGAIARPLGVRASSAESDEDAFSAIGRFLTRAEPLLLVLDNLEPVASLAAPAVATLLEAAPELRVLATSRELLRAQGEAVLELAPLPFPGPDERTPEHFDAVRLLHERARAVAPGWGGGVEDGAVVAAIVRRLEGFPLAIELCATRSRLLSPSEMLARLGHGLDVLGAGPRDAADRHRTLARAVDFSVQLLAPATREAFAQASVFAGSFDLGAAEAVLDLGAGAPPVLDVLETLADRSLLRPGTPSPGRFSMFAAIREHAAALLAERGAQDAAFARHAAHYLEIAERADAPALDAERDNLGAVLSRALARGPAGACDALRAALALDRALAPLGASRERFAALDAAVRAALATAAPPSLLSRGLVARARAHHQGGRGAEAVRDLEQAVPLASEAGDRRAQAEAHQQLAIALRVQRRHADAGRHGEHALAIVRELGLPELEIQALGALAAIDLEAGRVEGAAERFAHVEALSRRVGDRSSEAMAIAFQGHAHQELGRLAEAGAAFDRAAHGFAAIGDHLHAAVFAGYGAGVAYERRDLAAANDGYAGAAARLAKLGAARFEGLFRACLGAVLADLGLLEGASTSFDAASSLLRDAGDPALLLALDLHRLHLVARSAEGSARAIAEARALTEGSALIAGSDDVRFALRLLHRAASAQEPGAGVRLRVDPEGLWFEVAGAPRVSLARRRALRLLLRALVDARLRAPGQALDVPVLLAAGWPGERVRAEAGAHRVHVAISTLRGSGLLDLLERRGDGYLLAPRVSVALGGAAGLEDL